MRRNRKNKSPSWLKNRLADWKYWWTHGFTQKQRKWKKARKQRIDGIKRWKESRPIAAKIREQERRRSARKLNRSVKKAPIKFRKRLTDSALGFFKAPGKVIKASKRSYKRLRKLTLKQFLGELWDLYIGLIAYFINIPRRFYKRWKKQNAVIRAITAFTTVAVVFCLITSPILIDMAKRWRATQLNLEAQQLKDREQLNLAYEKSRSAALLAPDEEDYIEQTIDLADELRHPHAVWWAERMARQREFDEESLNRIINQSIDFNQLGTGARYVSVLRARFPTSQSTKDAELELLMSQGMLEPSLIKAESLIDQGVESPLAYRIFTELALRTSDDKIKSKGRRLLRERLPNKDAIGLELLKLAQLLKQEELEKLELGEFNLRESIVNHPDATRDDRIEANGFAFMSDLLDERSAYENITQEFNLEDEAELEEALATLSRFGNYYGRDQIISEVQINTDPQFALAYLEWLILSGDADLEEAKALMADDSDTPLPISQTKRRFWQAMVAIRQGNEEEFSLRILQALDNSSSQEWDYMHPILVLNTDEHQQHAFYRELFGRPESPIHAAERYLMLTYRLGLEEELQILLRQLPAERFANRADSMNFLLYLNAIHERNLPGVRSQLEQLIGEYPQAALFYRNLAFVYALLGERKFAMSIDREIAPPTEEDSPYIRLTYAYITQNSRYLPELKDLPTKREKEIWHSINADVPSL